MAPADASPAEREERFAADLARQTWSGGSSATVLERLLTARSAYSEARDALVSLKGWAAKKGRNLDYWVEGVDYNCYAADFLIAALEGTLSARANEMLNRLSELRHRTQDLFSVTYRAHSVQESLERRYGRFGAYLKKVLA
jgi:hypothetical protein